MLNLPLSYIFLKAGAPAEVTVVVAIVISQLCLAARLFMLGRLMDFPVRRFLSEVYTVILRVTICTSVVLIPLQRVFEDNAAGSIVNMVTCVAVAALCVLYAGCIGDERRQLATFISSKLKR